MKNILIGFFLIFTFFLNAQVLTVPQGMTNSTVCVGQVLTLTTSVTGGVPPYTYTWMVQGPCGNSTLMVTTTPSAVVVATCSPSQLFLVFINDAASAQVYDSVANVNTVNGLTLTAIANPTSICSGSSSTLIASGATSYSWSNGATGFQATVSPTASASYSVYGTSASCTNMQTVNVTVSNASLNITPMSATICSGNNQLLSVTGASSYTWSTGATSSSITVNPISTTVYSVTGVSGGCISSSNVTVNTSALKSLSGNVTCTAGAVNGIVTLYKLKSQPGQWDSISTVNISSSAYMFSSVASASYIVKALPSDSTQLGTYGSSSTSWQGATVFSHSCVVNSIQNINVVPILNIGSGPGTLSGKITEGVGYGQRNSNIATPGNPIGGVIVKGGRNPGGDIVSQGRTNPSGQYTLSGMPQNLAGESYFLLVDIPGLDTNNTYHRTIFTGAENYENLDFVVDSSKITPVDINVVVKELSIQNGQVSIYPNPTHNRITIVCELKKAAYIEIELMDITGRIVQSLLPKSHQAEGDVKIIAQLKDIKQGIYFVRMKVGTEERITRIVVTE